jgi:predicted dehydrogenase
MRGDIGAGVIGVGGRGSLARHAHRPGEGCRLVAGADPDKKARREFAERYGAGVSADYPDVLARSDVDAVFITSPDYCHEEQAIAALKAGKAVYLEKPMAITLAGCDRILAAAVENEGKLYLGHNMRHMAFVQKMKELVDASAIGEVMSVWCRHFVGYGGDAYFKDWHAERSRSTGLLLQKAAHDIDVIHWLCGGRTIRVNAMGGLTLYHRIQDRHGPEERGDPTFREENWPPLSQRGLNPLINVEDLSMMHMRLDNNVYASYQQCHYTPDAWRNYTVIGTEGRLENFGDGGPGTVIRVWKQRGGYMERGDEEYPLETEGGGHGGADPKIVEEFIRYVREGGRTLTSPLAARNSVGAGYMATLSLREGGRPYEVPPPSAEALVYFGEA